MPGAALARAVLIAARPKIRNPAAGEKKANMKNTATNDISTRPNSPRKYIPTIEEWTTIYKKHFDRLVGWLARKCDKELARDCVQVAFQKIIGLSECRLENPLQPLTSAGWVLFVHQQAEWVLGHELEKAYRWRSPAKSVDELAKELEAIRADTGLTPRQRELACKNRRRLLGYIIDLEGDEERSAHAVDALDGNLCSRRFRQLFEAVCDRHRVSDKVREAFRRAVIDGMPSTEVVLAVWGATDSKDEIDARKGNLFRIKNRIIGYLVEFAEEWKRNGGSLSSFLEAA